MGQGREEYRGHYARLAKEFAETPRVVVQLPLPTDGTDPGDVFVLGQLQILDLRQDDGHGVGVMIDKLPNGKEFQYMMYVAERVHLFSEFRDQLMQLANYGATSDGNLIGKSHRTILQKLGLIERANNGWNIITAAGVAEAEKAGWLKH